MGISSEEGSDRRMEGWLYLVRSNRLGLQYSRKRYFVLEDNVLNCYKAVPSSKREDPIRSALIDSCIRVTDNGRDSVHRNVVYIFTLYNASNHNDQLKLGARSSEEAAKWIRSLMEAALKVSMILFGLSEFLGSILNMLLNLQECPNREETTIGFSKRARPSFRL